MQQFYIRDIISQKETEAQKAISQVFSDHGLEEARQADIIAQKGSWYKVTVEGYIKALKKDYAHHSSSMYKDFYGEGKIYPNRANPYIITCKDDLEVFITRETIIS